MSVLKRLKENPVLAPRPESAWEAVATFNASLAKIGTFYHLLYRAVSPPVSHFGANLNLSIIGHAVSRDGVSFGHREPFIIPEHEWERYGCEDPRVTEFEGQYYIFYTALSTYPFTPQGIKVGLAITSDFKTIKAKHPVTTFNSKAMALFPERIGGKWAAILTVDTDIPPAKVALALFEKEEEIWSEDYWNSWYASLDEHVIPLLRNLGDQVEVGTAPIKTQKGWLFFHSYIKNYFSPERIFGIEAVLLDLENPKKVICRTREPLLAPEVSYELKGSVPNVIFPSGALAENDKLSLYYGAADTTVCLASGSLKAVLGKLPPVDHPVTPPHGTETFQRFEGNPIISPIPELNWQSRATFNPAAIFEDGRVHLLYRAVSQDNTSTFGYASSQDGFTFEERLSKPAYVPRLNFENKARPYTSSGCEDPRLTKIDDRFYICYTAFDGVLPPRVAFSSISVYDFLAKKWHWEPPKVISPPGIDDKDAFVLPEKFDRHYLVFHRIGLSIWVDEVDNLDFPEGRWLGGKILANPRKNKWDSLKIGVSTPAIKTEEGWLLLYHGVSEQNMYYCVGALLLALDDPTKVMARSDEPLFEPKEGYEKKGRVPNVVFPCGAVVLNGDLLIYYGGADEVTGVASASLGAVCAKLTSSK